MLTQTCLVPIRIIHDLRAALLVDSALLTLEERIRVEGLQVPLGVEPIPEGIGYRLTSGSRRLICLRSLSMRHAPSWDRLTSRVADAALVYSLVPCLVGREPEHCDECGAAGDVEQSPSGRMLCRACASRTL